MPRKGKDSLEHDIGKGLVIIFVLVGIVVVGLVAYNYLQTGRATLSIDLNPTQNQTPQQVGQTTNTNLQTVTRPIPIGITDATNSTWLASATAVFLNTNGQTVDSVTTGSTSATPGYTGHSWQSGTVFAAVECAKTGYVTQEYALTVPQMASADAYGSTYNYGQNFPLTALGSYTIKCMDNAGNSYTSSSTYYNFTASGNTVTFTFTFFETVNDAGWASSHDIITGQNWNLVANGVFSSTSGISVTGFSPPGQSATPNVGGYEHWLSVIPDTQATKVVNSAGSIVNGQNGQSSMSLTFTKGSFSSTGTFTVTVSDYGDINVYANGGSLGPSSSTLSTFVLELET